MDGLIITVGFIAAAAIASIGAIAVVSVLLAIFDSSIREKERKAGVFWNGHMHKSIKENRSEYEATRGLY